MSLNVLIAITIFCWGIWGIFDKKALDRASYRDVVLMMYLLYLPQVPIVALILNWMRPGWHIHGEVVLWTGLAAVCYTVAMVAYLTAMSKSEASYVLGITAGYPLVLQVLAVLLLGEQLVANRVLGAVLIGLGVFAIGFSREKQTKLPTPNKAGMLVCIALATICWGVYGLFDKKALAMGHPLEVYFVQCLWDLALLPLVAAFFHAQGHRPHLLSGQAWRYCALSAMVLTVGAFTYLSALAASTASYVIVITGCYPLLMYLFALLFLKEKFNRARLSGIGLVVIGGVIVQFTQAL